MFHHKCGHQKHERAYCCTLFVLIVCCVVRLVTDIISSVTVQRNLISLGGVRGLILLVFSFAAQSCSWLGIHCSESVSRCHLTFGVGSTFTKILRSTSWPPYAFLAVSSVLSLCSPLPNQSHPQQPPFTLLSSSSSSTSCQSRFRFSCSVHRTGIFSITNEGRTSEGCYQQTTWMRKTSE